MPSNPTNSLIEKIRRSIEHPSLYKKYFSQDNDGWSKFCVAMDTLEDSNLAISDFLAGGLGNTVGERYLRLYGVLQAIYIQQDAIRALWEIVVETDFPEQHEDSAWRTIRNIRNHTAGHPVEVNRSGVLRRTFVTRVGLEHGMLSLITDVNDGSSVYWGGKLEDTVTAYLAEAAALLQVISDRVPLKWPDLEVL